MSVLSSTRQARYPELTLHTGQSGYLGPATPARARLPDWHTSRLSLLLHLLFTLGFSPAMGLRQGERVYERVQAVRATGSRLAAKTCAGHIGGVRLGGPFLFVEVFPGGLTVRPIFQEPIAIRKQEVRKIFPELGRYVIAHTSPDIASPVIVSFVKGTALADALDQLAPD